MKLIFPKKQQRSTLVLLTVGALALTPLLMPVAAQADPPRQAPAWGRDKDRDRDERDRRDRNDQDHRHVCDSRCDRNCKYRHNDGGNGGGRQTYVITGVVTKDAGANQFWVRADNGQGYLVATRYRSAVVSTGMRVQVTGWYDGTRLNADSVRVLGYASGNGGYGDGQHGGNGGGYQGGGYGGGGYQGGGYGGGGYQGGWDNRGSEVNFPGSIQTVSYNDGVAFLQVRGDNGQIYSVRYRGTNAFRRGQRVRVIGKYGEGTVWATSVR